MMWKMHFDPVNFLNFKNHRLLTMKKIFLLFCLGMSLFSQAQNPTVQTIVDAVSIDSLIEYANEITGEVPVMINGNMETIVSRHKDNPGNALTLDYISEKLTSFGLTPTTMTFSGTGQNVYAVQPGMVYPDRSYVICGHFDAVPGQGPAPAADDDGSGTVAVIEAARILSQYQFEYTIVYAFWDEEEQGLLGSAYYAAFAAANDDTLMGVFNLDAIAYDGDGDDLMRVHTRPVANSEELADTVVSMNTTYNIGLNIAVNNPGATYSDHASFWNEGYGAVLIIEDFDNDGNPHYHTPTDLVQYYDNDYFEKLTKLSFASLATCAIPYQQGTGIASGSAPAILNKVYPNPFRTQCLIAFTLQEASQVQLLVHNALGEQVALRDWGKVSSGNHQFIFDGTMLTPGIYFYELVTTNANEQHRESGKLLRVE